MSLLGGNPVGQVLAVPVADVQVGERLRPVDAEWAEGLAGIMARDGQLTPIEVCRQKQGGFALVTGGHRLAAAALNGWETIDAIVVSGEWAERRLREVSENLWRRGLDPIDRAAFVAELVELAKISSGADGKTAQQVAIQARWDKKALKTEALNTSGKITDVYGWSSKVADRLGISLGAVEKDMLLHRRLSPQVKGMLAGHPVYRNAAQLRTLAGLEPTQQLEIAQMLLAGDIKSVGDGVSTLRQKPKPTAEAKRLATVLDTLKRMGKAERQGALDHIAAQYLHQVREALVRAQAFGA